jgi:hypothetical protein
MKKTTVTLIALILFIMLAGRAEATVFFSDGFESGNGSAWDGAWGTPSYPTSPKNSGTYSAFVDASGDCFVEDVSYPWTVFVRGYFRLNALPTDPINILRLWSDATDDIVTLWFTYSAPNYYIELDAWYDGGWHYSGPAVALAVDTWYCIELKFVVSPTIGECRVYLDGSEVETITSIDTSDFDVFTVLVGRQWDTETSAQLYIDDVVISDSYIGPLSISTTVNHTIKGTGSTSATAGLNVTNSSNTSLLYARNDGNVGINNTNPGSNLDVKGTLRISGDSYGYVGLAPYSTAGGATYTLPSTSGTNGQVLSTNGSGTLSWVNPPSNDLVVTHTEGEISPVTKTITYRTVTTDLSGANHVWIQQNLGADAPATSATDTSESSAGWYWQFNRKQGYVDGPTPAWTITYIDEAINWTADQDPCTLLLGTGWRLPTVTEWDYVLTNGGWGNYNDTYASCLRLHPAGYLADWDGTLYDLGSTGVYWSNSYVDNNYGFSVAFASGFCYEDSSNKASGFPVRCLK